MTKSSRSLQKYGRMIETLNTFRLLMKFFDLSNVKLEIRELYVREKIK